MNAHQAWQQLVGQLEMEMSKAAFDTWVRSAELLEYNENCFKVGVQNAYALDWLQSRLSSTIKRILAGLMDGPQDVEFVIYHKDYEEQKAIAEPVSEIVPPGQNPWFQAGLRSTAATISTILWSARRTAWRTPPAWQWRESRRCLQPALPLRRRRAGQNPPAARHRQLHASTGLAGAVRVLGRVHQRPDQLHPHP